MSASQRLCGPLPEVRESDDAGTYYCAHSLFLAHEVAREPETPLALDESGRPFLGFLHVPADAQATGGAPGEGARHDKTRAVVGAALAGWLPALHRRVPEGELRVLVTGFGPFRDVVDNPTGDFVRRPENLALALEALLVQARCEEGLVCGRVFLGQSARTFALHLVELAVDDRCLAREGPMSLRAALFRTRAHAWIGLGVCRSPRYRVEVAPSDVGLEAREGELIHAPDAPARTTLPRNRSLLEAIYEGAKGS